MNAGKRRPGKFHRVQNAGAIALFVGSAMVAALAVSRIAALAGW
jgi:hypothetical protein